MNDLLCWLIVTWRLRRAECVCYTAGIGFLAAAVWIVAFVLGGG